MDLESNEIRFWDREQKRLCTEKVYGNEFIRLLYNHPVGVWLTDHFLTSHWVSKLYGWSQSLSRSRKKVASFIHRFKVNELEFQGAPYSSFNDFFIRKFKPGLRPFSSRADEFSSPAEGRVLLFPEGPIDQKHRLKGAWVSISDLLNHSSWEETFRNGSVAILRLCPVDYHRFHFPDSGKVLDHYSSHGKLHSVNPLALKSKPDILFTNERQITVLETENFGKIAYVEVGALCVGKIVQTHLLEKFNKGDEKGYFLFGGSSLVLVAEPGKIAWDPDILEKTGEGIETLVKLGSSLGIRR